MKELIPVEIIERKIYLIRRHKVMLDRDLAALYGVETKALNRAVKRNLQRFPDDFMFQLTKEESENLRFHFGTSSWGGQRYLPYAFTENGVAMLSSVLSSERAVEVNIQIMRTFTRLREMLLTHKDLQRKIMEKMIKKTRLAEFPHVGYLINRILIFYGAIERSIMSVFPIPMGVSLVAGERI